MKTQLATVLLTLSIQGAPLLAQARDTPATPSRSADLTHRFDPAQAAGDFAQAIATLQD